MKKLLLFLFFCLLLFSTLASAELISHPQGTVRDTDNALVWINHPFSALNWSAATTFAGDLDSNGASDWRLPTLAELRLLLDTTKTPQISPLFTLGPAKNWSCWSSEPYTDARSVLSSRAYLLSFHDGSTFGAPVRSNYAFLVVRDFTGHFLLIDNAEHALFIDGAGHKLIIDGAN